MIRRWGPTLVSAALVAGLIHSVEEWRLLRGLRWGPLTVGLVVALTLDGWLGGVKWWWVLRSLGHKVPLPTVLKVWLGLLPLSFFAPMQTGHALYPWALHRASGVSLIHAGEAVLIDKGVSLLSTFALIGAGQWLLPLGHPLSNSWIALGAWLPVCLWFFDRPVLSWLRRWRWFAARSRLLQRPLSPGTKLKLLCVGVVYQSSDVISAWIACVALGLHVDPALVVGAFPLALLLSYTPVTVSGFGLREPATAWALGAAVSWQEGVLVGGVVDALEYVAPAVVGTAALPWLLRRLQQSDNAGRLEGIDRAP